MEKSEVLAMVIIKNNDLRKIIEYDLSMDTISYSECEKLKDISSEVFTANSNDFIYDMAIRSNISSFYEEINSNKDLKIIVGDDWYIAYTEAQDYLTINSIAIKNNCHKDISRACELLKGLKIILARSISKENRAKKYICCNLTSNSDYAFYLNLLFNFKRPLVSEEYPFDIRKINRRRQDYYRITEDKKRKEESNPYYVEFKVTDYGTKCLKLVNTRHLLRQNNH
jgi:hypothetical protein